MHELFQLAALSDNAGKPPRGSARVRVGQPALPLFPPETACFGAFPAGIV